MTAAEEPGEIRVGAAERERAIAALGEHWRAGRLDPAEHEARTTKAFAAVTRAELDALFADLPSGWPDGTAAATARAGDAVTPAPTAAAEPAKRSGSSAGPLVPEQSALGQRRDLIMAILPFLCLLLFFTVVRTWLIWLLIPIAGIVLYGPDGKKGRRDPR